MSGTVEQLEDDNYFVTFDYDEQVVSDWNDWRGKTLDNGNPSKLRGIYFVSGKDEDGRYIGDKGWVVPNKHMVELASFAKEHDWNAPTLEGDLNPHWVGRATDGSFYVQFPYDPDNLDVIGELKGVSGATFDKNGSKVWRVPKRSKKDLEAFAEENGFAFTDRVRDFSAPSEELVEELI